RGRLDEQRRWQRARTTFRVGGGASSRSLLALALGLLALVYFLHARDERDASRSREQAQQALHVLQSAPDPADGVRAAFAAFRLHRTPEAEEALRTALVDSHRRAVLAGHGGVVFSARFSND